MNKSMASCEICRSAEGMRDSRWVGADVDLFGEMKMVLHDITFVVTVGS